MKSAAPPAHSAGSTRRSHSFTTISGRAIAPVYGPPDLRDFDYARDLADPGLDPYTRSVDPDGYHGRLWTMRQSAGGGTPEDANARYRQLLTAGATGLSVTFDLPTVRGRDPDHRLSAGEVGKRGVNVASLADMEILFDGIDLSAVTASLMINAPAPMLLAMYLVVAEKRDVSWDVLGGATQNDVLGDLIARRESIYPPRPSTRLAVDLCAFCADRVPRWDTMSAGGYQIREAGATAAQELAFALGSGIEYVQHGINAGLGVDVCAPRVSCSFSAHSDFFEEVAKYRAARRIWARVMRDRFKAEAPRSLQLRFHTRTARASLTVQQPYNNAVRTALQAMAAVIGGAQSLQTNSFDEAVASPSGEAEMLALRTQQIIGYETGITSTVDPFGGSYFIEKLTADLESDALACIDTIDGMGGMVAALERGYPQREVAESARRFQRAVEQRDRIVVGVNEFVEEEPADAGRASIDARVAERQMARLTEIRARRDARAVAAALVRLQQAARGTENTMPALLDAARAYATIGEMCDALRTVWGEYEETS